MNEYVGFLFAIEPNTAIDKPMLRIHTPAVSGADTLTIDLARVHAAHIDRFPGWHVRSIPPSLREHDPLDVLVPLDAVSGGMPSRLEAAEEYVFWVELMAPKGTVPGPYMVPLVLESAGKLLGTMNIELTVWPMVLPDDAGLLAIGEVDHQKLFRHHLSGAAASATRATAWHDQPMRAQYDDIVMATLQLLHMHRIAPVLSNLSPGVKVSPRGTLTLDWSGYDAVVGPLMDGRAFEDRVPLPVWPLPLRAMMGSVEDGTFSAAGSQTLISRYVEECAGHFQQQGWFERSYALVEGSELASAGANNDAQRTNLLIRDARPDIRIASRGFPQDMKQYGWFDFRAAPIEIPTNIWIPDAQYFDPRVMADQRARGRQVWLGVDRPPFSGTASTFSRPSDTLVLGWQARFLGAQALWLGPVNAWNDTELAAPELAAANNALILPGKSFGLARPVPTLRLKRLRETIQHAAYVQLLGQHGRGHIAKSLESELVRYAGTSAYRTHFADGRQGGWEPGEEAYRQSQQVMAQEMIDLVGSPRAGPAEKDSPGQGNSILWRKLEGKERGVVARIDGSRVRLTGTPSDAKVQIETWATLTNQERADVRAQVSIPGAPAGCVPIDAHRNLEIGAGKSARTLMTLTCEPLWLQTARESSLAIQVLAPDQPEFSTMARVSMVVAEPTARPLNIDGDLSDWAAASSNVASDFRLIAGPCEEPELACDRPALRTFAFTRRDAEYLYVAVNAEARQTQRNPTARRKSVVYDDLIPMDEEDLIEILIDPLNGGTRSPADLYHIVVKRSGVYLIERGITTHPPLGPRIPWQADIDVASREQPTRWIAEVRIPLASLGSPGRRGEIFGFNVTHYNAADQEFSNWAGAVGNAYDPLSLGNLFLP